jgi:hypothetical protein
MTRSVAHRTHAVQLEKSSSPETARRTESSPPTPRAPSVVPWYWQIVMFLWITSYLGLLLYEWLVGILKAW